MKDAIPRLVQRESGSQFPAASVHGSSKARPRRSRKGEKRSAPILCDLAPDLAMGRGCTRRGDRSPWHIVDRDDQPICGRQLSWAVEYAPRDDPAVGRICRPCHVRQSWTPMPQDVEYEDRGYLTLCRIWTRGKTWKGYAERVTPGQKTPTHAHREAYEAAYGPIPAGFVIHHHCEQRDCLEPTHLEAMSRADHIRLHMGDAKRLGRSVDTA